jgi:YesN/AraC family two-component response regulator
MIFISGSNDREHKKLAKDLGSLEYLTKPVDAEQLIKTLHSLDTQLALS